MGVWIAVLLFLGFPQGWQKILAIATGLYLIVLAYSLKIESPKTTDLRVPFVDHKKVEQPQDVEPVTPVTPVIEQNNQ